MRKFLPGFVFLSMLSTFLHAQYAPNLGTGAGFILFSQTGFVSNSGTSHITGDIGNNAGNISGFGSPSQTSGVTHTNDVVAWTAAFDIATALGQLNTQNQAEPLPAVIGNGESVGPGIYKIPGNSLVQGELLLDGGGDSEATFVFQVSGTLTTAALCNINLVNGARPCNVFWAVCESARFGAATDFSGTVITKGSIVFENGCTLNGHAFSTAGPISLDHFTGILPEGPSIRTLQPDCSNTTGTITIGSPVAPGFTYSVGGTFQSSPIFPGLIPATYYITVKGTNGMFVSSGVSSVILPQYEPALSVNLGTAAKFVLFSSAGTLSNANVSCIHKGDIGTKLGTCTGLGFPTLIGGNIHAQDATASQAAADLVSASTQLKSMTPTGMVTGNPLNGQYIQAGIYKIAGNFSQTGNLVLDGGGDPAALFVFQVAGNLSTAARSSLVLSNKARASRVFWVVDGNVQLAAQTTFHGSIISNGSIVFGEGCILKGRAMSMSGEVSLNNTLVMPPFQCPDASAAILPVTINSFTAAEKVCKVLVSFEVLSQKNTKVFTIQYANGEPSNWMNIGTIQPAGTPRKYEFVHNDPNNGSDFYRLRIEDMDGKFTYSNIVKLGVHCSRITSIALFPNPVQDQFTVRLPDGMEAASIRVINSFGQVVKILPGKASDNIISMAGLASGIYLVQVIKENEVKFTKAILKN